MGEMGEGDQPALQVIVLVSSFFRRRRGYCGWFKKRSIEDLDVIRRLCDSRLRQGQCLCLPLHWGFPELYESRVAMVIEPLSYQDCQVLDLSIVEYLEASD
jgi:hypothetical protein